MLKLRSWLVTLALTFLIPATAFAYTNADFSGSYAPSVSGPSSVALASEPLTVGTGVMIADGAGNVSGHATLRSHGAACNGTFDSGLYTSIPTVPVISRSISIPPIRDAFRSSSMSASRCPAMESAWISPTMKTTP